MRIALLTAANTWSGVEVHTIYLARTLIERGHEVVIVELGRRVYAEARQVLPCPVQSLACSAASVTGGLAGVFGLLAWRRAFGQVEADVAIVAKGTFKFSTLAMEAAGRLRFPHFFVVEHLHAPLGKRPGGFYFHMLPRLNLWWFRAKFSGYLRSVFPHKVICVSHAVANTLSDDYGFPSSKLAVAHSGVDTELFAPNPALYHASRLAWGIPDGAFVFGTVGRLSPMKNHDQLIRAFARLVKIGNRDMRLVIVGEGPLQSALEALVMANELREHVIFTGFTDTPYKVIPAFDVFCFPSTTGESLGIALLEAMSCGCPPVAAAVGGVPEIVNDRGVGWLVTPGDENELALTMKLVCELDHEALRKIGANARERVLERFDASDRWNELVSVVEKCCG